MNPTKILDILDLAKEARRVGKIFNPLFTGDAGLGKSAICQQWVKKQRETNPDFGFVDLRIAYLEAPDLIGFPNISKDENGKERTKHALPEFWPTEGEGLLLIEEPNRGTTGVLNCLMQLLTDRKVHKYELPEGWIVASAINPDTAEYDVNAMDAALKNRFEEFEITFDHNALVSYMDKNDFSELLQLFVASGTWIFKPAKDIKEGGKYISPRTIEKMDAAEKAGAAEDRSFHDLICRSIFGKDIGRAYWEFCHKTSPVLASDLLKNKKDAFKRLKKQSNKNNYQGDLITSTVESIVTNYGGLEENCEEGQVSEALMAEVAKIIPSDQAINLIKECGFKQASGKIADFFKEFIKRHPTLTKVLKSNIRINRATKVDK